MQNFDIIRFNNFLQTIFYGATTDFLVGGNIEASVAKSIIPPTVSLFENKTYGGDRQIYKIHSEEKLNLSLAINHNDLAILKYYQGRNDSPKEEASIILLKQLIGSDFFHELRTKKQLGYIVAVVNQKVDRIPGISLLIQSPEASVIRMGQEIDKFLLDFFDQLKMMTEEDFLKQKESVLLRLQEKPKNLLENLSQFWQCIITRNHTFDRREKLIFALQKISHKEILNTFSSLIIKSGYSFQIDSGDSFSFDKKEFQESREAFTFHTK
jgi:secreted Zn-dependent insulinase-like peptidase